MVNIGYIHAMNNTFDSCITCEKEAMDQFVNTKIGEPSRMGSK
jgi:hypothetical protein